MNLLSDQWAPPLWQLITSSSLAGGDRFDSKGRHQIPFGPSHLKTFKLLIGTAFVRWEKKFKINLPDGLIFIFFIWCLDLYNGWWVFKNRTTFCSGRFPLEPRPAGLPKGKIRSRSVKFIPYIRSHQRGHLLFIRLLSLGNPDTIITCKGYSVITCVQVFNDLECVGEKW